MKKKQIKRTQKKQNSKIIIFLLVAAVLVAGLFLANYINTQQATTNTEAAGKVKCPKARNERVVNTCYEISYRENKELKQPCYPVSKVVSARKCGIATTNKKDNGDCPGKYGTTYIWNAPTTSYPKGVCVLKYGQVGYTSLGFIGCVDKVMNRNQQDCR